jgi:hypothetical protein
VIVPTRSEIKNKLGFQKMRSASGVAINSSAHSIQRKMVGFVFVREKDRAAQASIYLPLFPENFLIFRCLQILFPQMKAERLMFLISILPSQSFFDFAPLKVLIFEFVGQPFGLPAHRTNVRYYRRIYEAVIFVGSSSHRFSGERFFFVRSRQRY